MGCVEYIGEPVSGPAMSTPKPRTRPRTRPKSHTITMTDAQLRSLLIVISNGYGCLDGDECKALFRDRVQWNAFDRIYRKLTLINRVSP